VAQFRGISHVGFGRVQSEARRLTAMACNKYAFHHIFDRVWEGQGIVQRLAKFKHSWSNGRVERMNRTIKEATVRSYRQDIQAQLSTHLQDFISACNYGRWLNTLRGLVPYKYICKY
jgi:hypothetical protein